VFWEEISFTDNGNYILYYPDGKLTIIIEIDKKKIPADWDCYGSKHSSNFLVSGYGRNGSHETYGTKFYESRYNWKNQKHTIKIFSHVIIIECGKQINIGDQQFFIDYKTPLILEISIDGKVKQLPETESIDIPVRIISPTESIHTIKLKNTKP
jgi:hypothetical protein